MRYCPNCKKHVGKQLTNGQIVTMSLLFSLFIIPGIFYAVLHDRKCPICRAPTEDK